MADNTVRAAHVACFSDGLHGKSLAVVNLNPNPIRCLRQAQVGIEEVKKGQREAETILPRVGH